MRDQLEAARSEIFDVVPFQESRQLGIAEHTENSGLGCAQSPRPRSLPAAGCGTLIFRCERYYRIRKGCQWLSVRGFLFFFSPIRKGRSSMQSVRAWVQFLPREGSNPLFSSALFLILHCRTEEESLSMQCIAQSHSMLRHFSRYLITSKNIYKHSIKYYSNT